MTLTSTPEKPASAVPQWPQRAPNIQLIGEIPDSAFVDRQWLVQRDGQFVQLTELLYRIVEQIDGTRTFDDIAEGVTESTDWLVTGNQVRDLIASRLLPTGLVVDGEAASTAQRPQRAEPSPLAVNMRLKAIGPRVIEPITAVLQYLFVAPLVVALVAGGIAAHWWLYTEHGLLDAFIDALYTPGVLLILLGVVLASGIVHEFGHASALRYGGGHARRMGFGFYAVFPVFFTDATDSYRLGRWARVRTGLGGVYFHFIFSLALMGFALATGNEFLLIAVLLINLEIVHQFIPFMRLDGYWVLTDLTGVPDFFSQTGPFLRSLVPKGMVPGTKLPALKRWAQVVFVAYIALTIPVLAFLLFLLVKRLPGILTVAWDAIATHAAIVRDAAGDGDVLTLATSLAQILVLGLPIVGIAYVLYTLAARPLKAAWRQPTVERRSAGVLAITAVIAAVGVYWVGTLAFAAESAPAGVRTFDVPSNSHVKTPVAYPQIPPVGGNHDPVPQNCGFYSVPVRNENAVHSLEHGAIWITYRPGLSRGQIEHLRSLARREKRILVSPYPGLGNPIVVSSWGHRMPVSTARDARIDRFVRVFRDSSDAPEPGGPCSGGRATGR